MVDKPNKTIEQIILEDGRYPLQAVQFVREGLNRTVEKSHPQEQSPLSHRHVSGKELCFGLCELALQRWGMMARMVLNSWHITSTRDFGEIVFLLVDNGWMRKEPGDHIEDFDDVFDFAAAMDDHFEMGEKN